MGARTGWITLVAAGFVALLALDACNEGSTPEVLECITNNDCPPACTCFGAGQGSLIGKCWFGGADADVNRIECAGTCDAETECPEGMVCRAENPSSTSLVRFSCQPALGTGGTGGNGGAGGNGATGGSAGAGGVGGSDMDPCGGDIECTPEAPSICGTECQDICGGFENFDSAGCGDGNRCYCVCVEGVCTDPP